MRTRPDGSFSTVDGVAVPPSTAAETLSRLRTLASLDPPSPSMPGICAWISDGTSYHLSWASTEAGALPHSNPASPFHLLDLLSSATFVVGHSQPDRNHSCTGLSRQIVSATSALADALSTLLGRASALLVSGDDALPEVQVLSLTGDSDPPASDHLSSIPEDTSIPPILDVKKARTDPPAPTMDLPVPSTMSRALLRLCPPMDFSASHLVVSGIPTDIPARELYDTLSDILEFHGLPIDDTHLREQLGISPTQPWQGDSRLLNIQRQPGGVSPPTADPTGSLIVQLSQLCTFGSVLDRTALCFQRVLSEPGALFAPNAFRQFHPLLHFNPELEENLPAVSDPDSLLFVVRGGTGVDATDSFLCSRVHSLQDLLKCGPISVHVESSRRGLRVPTVDKRGKATATSRFSYEILLMVRLLDTSSERNAARERAYDQVRQWCRDDSHPHWSAEESTGVLSQCPVLWLLTDELVFELYAPFYTQYMDKFRSTYSYPHFTRGSPRAVSVVTLLPPIAPRPPTVSEFVSYLCAHRYDVDSISCIFPLPPVQHHQASNAPSRTYCADSPSHRMVIVWSQGVSRLLPSFVSIPGSTDQIRISVVAEEADNLPGFWTAGEQTTKKLYFNGFMRMLHAQYLNASGPGARPGLAPTIRSRQYSAPTSPLRTDPRPSSNHTPPTSPWNDSARSRALRSSPSSPDTRGLVTRPRPSTPQPFPSTVVPAPSSSMAAPSPAYDLNALVSSLTSISGQLHEQNRLFADQARMFQDMQRTQQDQQAQLDDLRQRLHDTSKR